MFANQNRSAVHRETFCNQWKKQVVAFCLMFLGQRLPAEEVACEVLVTFSRNYDLRKNVPYVGPRLIAMAIDLMKKLQNTKQKFETAETATPLERALQTLPSLERSILIMRNLLHMNWHAISLAADVSSKHAHCLWTKSILQLQEQLGLCNSITTF